MRSECLPITRLPHVTRLHRDFLSGAPGVREFYPAASSSSAWLEHGTRRRDYPGERRRAVADILERQNLKWGAPPATLANLGRLRDGASAIVTGQQVSLFGGPVFAILKAITAVKRARQATEAGYPHVPVFWMATEDHDLAEIDHVKIPAAFGQLARITAAVEAPQDAPVGSLDFGRSTENAVEQVAELLGDAEITDFLRESYLPGRSMGEAYAVLLTRIFGPYGLIVIDPADADFHAIGRPVFEQAFRKHKALASGIDRRNGELEAAGYHAQVSMVDKNSLLFLIENGRRSVLRFGSGQFRAGARQWTLADLEAELQANPERFSPNVLLRPVFQDYLLPTSAYIAGPAEIAYFAQADIVYREILGQTTPVLPRLSATLVEPRVHHWLERYGLSVPDIFVKATELAQRMAAQAIPIEIKRRLSATGNALQQEVEQLKRAIEKIDPTLVRAAEKSSSKMQYQMNRLRRLAANAELRKNEEMRRHAEALSTSLYPDQNLQEREIAGAYFLARYGMQLVAELFEMSNPDCTDHQIFYL